jgi:ssDNA-binding Zn-finger/Zn-ribbon topoisomerase 1
MKYLKTFTESYNTYSRDDQKSEICPDCGETKDLELLGPKDYKRDEHGNYRRTMGYRCNNCKSVFSVDKNK